MNGKIPINKQTNNFFVMETDKINEALEVMPSSPLSGKRGLMKDEFCAEISIYCIRINPSQSVRQIQRNTTDERQNEK